VDTAVEVEGLFKSYGPTEALRGVDLSVGKGTVFGLLGPNGAGKTTIVRILSTLLRPDAGRATVAGHDLATAPHAVRASIGMTGQFAASDEHLTGRENLQMIGRLSRMPADQARIRAVELLEEFDLVEASDRPLRTYSGGMKRRLDLAASMVGKPAVLFLDEPTTGLDPRSRLQTWEVVRHLVASGTTILLTTQYLEEADELADVVAVIDNGRIIAEGTPSELKQQVGGARIEVNVGHPEQTATAVEVLTRVCSQEAWGDFETGTVHVPAEDPALLAKAVRALDEANVDVVDLSLRRPSLDDVFLALTGHIVTDAAPAREHAG